MFKTTPTGVVVREAGLHPAIVLLIIENDNILSENYHYHIKGKYFH